MTRKLRPPVPFATLVQVATRVAAEGGSQSDAARELDIYKGSVRERLHRAGYHELADALAANGRTLAAQVGADVARKMAASGEERLDEVQFLLASGEDPENVLRRMGIAADTLAKQAHRHERYDMARVFWRVRWQQRQARDRQAAA